MLAPVVRRGAVNFLSAKYSEYAKANTNMASVHLDLALVLKVLQQSAKAREYFRKAVEGFREKLARNTENFDTLFKLGTALAELKQLDQATEYLQQVVDIKSTELECQLMFAKALLAQQRNDEAAAALKKAIAAISNTANKDDVAQLKRYLQLIQNKNNKSSSPASTDSQRI